MASVWLCSCFRITKEREREREKERRREREKERERERERQERKKEEMWFGESVVKVYEVVWVWWQEICMTR